MGLTVNRDFMSEQIASSEVQAAPEAAPQAHVEERRFTQAEVNALVGSVRKETRQSVLSEAQQYSPQAASAPTQRGMDAEAIRALVNEEKSRWVREHQEEAAQQYAQKIAGEFLGKVADGKTKYADFEQVADINYGAFPLAVSAINSVDNVADVVYEMGKDRTKLALLQQLAERSPQDAIRMVQSLSKSIKENEAANNRRKVPAPLGQLKSSTAGIEGRGAQDMNVKELSKLPSFRV
jgi:hypothetical protein